MTEKQKHTKSTQPDEDSPIIENTKDNSPQFHMFNSMSRENLDNFIDNLYNPRFMGSVHMKKDTQKGEKNQSIEVSKEMLKNELKLKLDDSLKNTLFNPITKILILGMIIFNLVYFLFLLF